MSKRDRVRYEIRAAHNNVSRQDADRHGCAWTQSELDYLHENYTHASADEVAAVLRRTVEACKQMFYLKPDRESQNVHQERVTTRGQTPGQRQWEQGFTDLSDLDREVDFSKLGW